MEGDDSILHVAGPTDRKGDRNAQMMSCKSSLRGDFYPKDGEKRNQKTSLKPGASETKFLQGSSILSNRD